MFSHFLVHSPKAYRKGRNARGEAGIRSSHSTLVTGIQSLKSSPQPPRVSMSRKLELETTAGKLTLGTATQQASRCPPNNYFLFNNQKVKI